MKLKNLKIRGNISIELLRIWAMFGIIAQHYSLYAHPGNVFGGNSIERYITEFIYDLSFNGSELFVLVAAYFLCKDTTLRFDRLKKLLIQVAYFEIVLVIVGVAFNGRELNADLFWSGLRDHWFIQAYIALYLIHPILNILIKNLTKDQHLKIVLWGFLFVCVLGHIVWPQVLAFENGYSLAFFVYLYFVGSYCSIHLNIDELTSKIKPPLFAFGYLFFATICWKMQFFNSDFPGIDLHFSSTGLDAPWFFLKSLCLFIFVLTIKINYPKPIGALIQFFSSAVFGIYLLHENAMCGELIWKKIFDPSAHATIPDFWFYYLFVEIAIFFSAAIISKILMIPVDIILKMQAKRKELASN